MDRVDGKTVLITGAAGGLGRALAKVFAGAGARIAMTDRSLEDLRPPESENAVFAHVELDVTDIGSWQTALEKIETQLGPVDILINNAGLGQISPVASADPVVWRRTLDVNVLGPFYGCRLLLPKMLARQAVSHIINISSEAAFSGPPGLSAYCASKNALLGLSRTLRHELAGTQIGISVVCPGMLRTDLVLNSMVELSRVAELAPPDAQVQRAAASALQQGMEPLKVAERILKAVLDGDFYVFTHAAIATSLADQYEEMRSAVKEDADPAYAGHIDLAAFRANASGENG